MAPGQNPACSVIPCCLLRNIRPQLQKHFKPQDSFIKPAAILKARRTKLQPIGELVLGVDPARGGDRFSIARRRGRVVPKVESRKIGSITDGAGWVKQVIDIERPKRVFIDVGGLGVGVYDLLVDWGYREIVRSVDFGGKPIEPPKRDEKGEEIGGCPLNRRAEMWLASRTWLDDPGGASIPDSDTTGVRRCDALGA